MTTSYSQNWREETHKDRNPKHQGRRSRKTEKTPTLDVTVDNHCAHPNFLLYEKKCCRYLWPKSCLWAFLSSAPLPSSASLPCLFTISISFLHQPLDSYVFPYSFPGYNLHPQLSNRTAGSDTQPPLLKHRVWMSNPWSPHSSLFLSLETSTLLQILPKAVKTMSKFHYHVSLHFGLSLWANKYARIFLECVYILTDLEFHSR